MSDPNICIFRLSKKEEFPGGIKQVEEWIKNKSRGDGRYHFRRRKPRDLPVGSVVVFSIEGKIIGEGIVKQTVRPTPPNMRRQLKQRGDHDYLYYTILKPSSLTIYNRFPETKEVSRQTGLGFSRLFTYIRRMEQYRSILEMAESSSITKRVREVPDAPFRGFSKEIFDSCKASPAINNVRDALERLRLFVEPEMKKLNPRLNGKVSEAKQRMRGGVGWTDWAWLMFTLAPLGSKDSSRPGKPIGAGKLTQLTVNMSKKRLYAGLCLRTYSDRVRLQEALRGPEYDELFEEIAYSLSGRRWIITRTHEDFSEKRARYFSTEDLHGKLLDPRLRWINASFSRNDQMVSTRRISTEIVSVFTELFNLFALANAIHTIDQPKPTRHPPHTLEVLVDMPPSRVVSDEEEIQSTLNYLAKLKIKAQPSRIVIPKKIDTYPVERIALPLNLSPKVFHDSSGPIRYWIERKRRKEEIISRANLLRQLRLNLDQIAKALGTSPEFLQIMVTSPQTDARYTKSNRILVNLLRYEKIQMIEFWLFAIAREIAYIRHKRLSYQHINFMRKVLLVILSKLRADKLEYKKMGTTCASK